MANQAQIPHYDAVIDAEADENPLADDNEKLEEEILGQFNADGDEVEYRVKIKRVNPETKKQEDCFYMSPDELPTILDRLKAEYGYGEFRAYVQKNGKTVRNMAYRIAKPLDPAAAPQQPSQITDLASLLRENNRQLMDFFRNQQTPPASDPAQVMNNMMGVFEKMMGVMQPKKDTSGDAVTMLIKGIELAKSFEGGGDKNMFESIVDLANSDLGKEAAKQLQERSANAQPAQPGQVARAQPAQIKQNPQQETPPQNTKPLPAGIAELPQPIIAQIGQTIQLWNDRAKKGSSPELYAELAIDTYPAEFVQMVLGRPDLQEIVFYFAPDAQENWFWFEALRTEVYALLTEEPETGENVVNDSEAPQDVPTGAPTIEGSAVNANEDTGGQSGGSGDVGDHAPVGETG